LLPQRASWLAPAIDRLTGLTALQRLYETAGDVPAERYPE
jgi:hypothetical protein